MNAAIRGFESIGRRSAGFFDQIGYGSMLFVESIYWLFFGWRLGYWAFADVVLLWLLIAATVAAFFTRHRGAALLLLPYWAWVSFATALTWTVWRANPALLGT